MRLSPGSSGMAAHAPSLAYSTAMRWRGHLTDARAQTLLKTLIERYIAEGQPIGSRTLSKYSGLELSPASIRNVMATVAGSAGIGLLIKQSLTLADDLVDIIRRDDQRKRDLALRVLGRHPASGNEQ